MKITLKINKEKCGTIIPKVHKQKAQAKVHKQKAFGNGSPKPGAYKNLPLVLNRSPIIFKNFQIKSKSVNEGMNRRIFSC